MKRIGAFGAAALLLLLAAAPAIAATMPEVRMKVVDEASGTPIQGVVALFSGTAREGTLTGHGGRYALLFAVEAVTDAAGELRFPGQEFGSQPFFLNTNYENPTMLLLKAGYAPLVLRNQLRIIPTLAEASRWEYDGRTVKMQKATNDEMQRQADLVTLHTNLVVGADGGCGWKRAPLSLATADRLFQRPGRMSTLRMVLLNEAGFVRQGCGSPKAFFEARTVP